MSIRYNFNGNQFVHQIKRVHVETHSPKSCIKRMCTTIASFFKNLWSKLCCCLKSSERTIEQVPLEKPEWSDHVMGDSITTRNNRLDNFYTPNLMPITRYFDLVRRNYGYSNHAIIEALTNLDPSTTPMVSNNYALILRKYHQLAFEEAIVIQEAMIFEGAHSIPAFNRYLPRRPNEENADDPEPANDSASTSYPLHIASMPSSPATHIDPVNASDVDQDAFIDDDVPAPNTSLFGILLQTKGVGECCICYDLLTNTRTSCCHVRICFDCFSNDIVAKTKQDFNNWMSRNQMVTCINCQLPFQLNKHEKDLSGDAKNILSDFSRQYTISLYSEHSNGTAVECQEENCKKSYLVEENNTCFQCNNITAHSDQRIRLYHIDCRLLWQFDHECPASEKNKIRNSIEVIQLLIRKVDTIRRCPGMINGAEPCKALINKNDGCNHMTCTICTTNYCWVCEQDWAAHSSAFYHCTAPDVARQAREMRLSELREELTELQQLLRNSGNDSV